MLYRVDLGRDSLDEMIPYGIADLQECAPVARENLAKGALSVAEMCKAAVELSDNTCANLLLARVGGPPAVTAFWRRIGDGVSRLDHDEPLLNCTPRRRGSTGGHNHARRDGRRPPSDRPRRGAFATFARALHWMDAQLPNRREPLRAGLPTSWRIGSKTGNNGKDAAGDIAVAWPSSGGPVLVCVYTRGGTPTAVQLQTVFADVGRLVAPLSKA